MTRRLVYAVLTLIPTISFAADSQLPFFGLLRSRDLTPFGYLRLDMRPPDAVAPRPGTWAVETELGYQNTWALSPRVERYLESLPGRRELGQDEWRVIRDLPGENYLVDLELAQLDFTLHRQISAEFGAYLILSGATYGGGFLDGIIEEFHETFGFTGYGRPAAARNDANVLLDLKSIRYAAFAAPVSGGLLDPIVGVRYTVPKISGPWRLVLEGAIKMPFSGSRAFLSTGRADVGVQVSVQRRAEAAAIYANVAAVYYAGTNGLVPAESQFLPTLVLGYERRLAHRTSAVLQGYVSPSPYGQRQTDLRELVGTKYQLSLGLRHLEGRHLFSFAVTENLQNTNNTPDIGFQLGWAYFAW